MTAIVNTVKQHIPDLVALNLSNNRLSSLQYLQPLVAATPNLVGLDLSNNAEVRALCHANHPGCGVQKLKPELRVGLYYASISLATCLPRITLE